MQELTPRQKEVTELMREGKSTKELRMKHEELLSV